jgi:hypothetical protein
MTSGDTRRARLSAACVSESKRQQKQPPVISSTANP